MNSYSFTKLNLRLAKAKISLGLSNSLLLRLLTLLTPLIIASAIAIIILGYHIGFSLAGAGVMMGVLLTWLRHDLTQLTPATIGTTTALDQLLPADLVSHYSPNLTAPQLLELLLTTRDTRFIFTRFGLDPNAVTAALANTTVDHDQLFTATTEICQGINQPTLTAGTLTAALFQLSPPLKSYLATIKLEPDDVIEGAYWLIRFHAYAHAPRPLYGGLARDWAAGFTPLLNQFGTNLATQVQYAGRFVRTQERTEQLQDLVTALDSATGSVAMIGETGIGKTALLLALADDLLADDGSTRSLQHHQIYSLNASLILSNAKNPGDIEGIVLALLDEAMRAGNIVIALDEAQLFFGQGTGAVNLSQVLLPIVQNRALKLVLAFTPGDWQRLRATNSALASLLTPLVLREPDQQHVIRLLADRALLMEEGRLTTWSALVEAHRLSGRYFQDEADPGRSFHVLEAAFNHPQSGNYITETSVQQAIESELGVKVQAATAQESDTLLHLEDRIHERMINQTRAVSVVASALRRARAGVSNPKRPIGSFLFLGPTGVGKTELAKSIAALYFGDETNLIRLDMSEYQQVADVDRMLSSSADNPEGLLARIRQNPFSVVLFDEIEKAHPNLLNLFLQLLDEGNLTDVAGHPASFKDAIIITTSNAGADEIRAHIEAGQALEDFEEEFTNDLINAGIFKPEFLNRFDEIVLFRPLNQAELGQVVQLMIREVNHTLEAQKIQVQLTDAAITELVTVGYDPRLGARPMRRMVTRRVEDAVAAQILSGTAHPGDTITLDVQHLDGQADAQTEELVATQ